MDFLRGYAAFLDYRYWFSLHPVPLSSDIVNAILSFFAWFIVAAVVLRVTARSMRKTKPRVAQLLRKLASPLMVTGIIGLLLLFFTYEQAPVLGMRMWFLFLALYFLFLVGRVAHYVVLDYPQLRHHDAERERINRYLPKKK